MSILIILFLASVLFIDVGENTSYSQIMTNAFVYGHVGRDMTPDAWISTRFKYVSGMKIYLSP